MTQHMLALLFIAISGLIASACETPRCQTDDNCPPELPFCGGENRCVETKDESGEGEGEAGEGEGEAGEGEGEAGEGEGEAGEGEGEEGEGEGESENRPPVAEDDAATTPSGQAIRINVLTNDSDLDGDVLDVSVGVGPAGGDVVVEPAGVVLYTPRAATRGVDTFSYLVADGQGGQDTATVSVTVTPEPLVLTSTSLPAGDDDTAYGATLLASGGAPPYTFASDELPQGLILATDGALTGTPTASGSFQFNVDVIDVDGTAATGEVTLVIRPDNTVPGAVTLAASYAGVVNQIKLTFRAPGDDNTIGLAATYELRRSRDPINAASFDAAAVVDIGGAVPQAAAAAETFTVTQDWYDGVFHYALRTTDSSGNSSLSNSLAVDTTARLDIEPDLIAYGEVPFSAAGANVVDVTVTVTAPADSLVDAVVTTVVVDDAAFTVDGAPGTLGPGEDAAVTLSFTPTVAAAVAATLSITHSSGTATAAIEAVAVNVAPTITRPVTVLASVNATTTLRVEVVDQNGAADVASVVANLSAVGGGTATTLTLASPGVFTTTFTATGASGTRNIPVLATDVSGATATGTATAFVFSGTAREVGPGKPFADIKSAITAASTGELIAIFPGTYAGANNKNLVLGGKVLTFLGIEGAENTIVDCNGAGRAFNITDGSGTSLIGLTFTRCVLSAVRTTISLTIANSRFVDNSTAATGGAVVFEGGAGTQLTITGSGFIGNEAVGSGGAVDCRGGGEVTVEDSTFEGNASLTSDPTGFNPSGGGGVALSSGLATVRRSVFRNNEANSGGGVYVASGTASVIDSTFDDNIARTNGGAIHVTASAALPLVVGSSFNKNSAQGDRGGAIQADSSGSAISLRDNVFTNNKANGDTGSAIMCFSRPTTIDNCQFTGHLSDGSAGRRSVVAFTNGTIKNSEFSDNTITSVFTVGADALVEDTLFANNDARFGPGAIDLVAGTVRRSVFLDNRGNGGAISTAQSGQTIEVADSVFDGNVSTTSGGAIKHAAGSHILLRNSLLTSNSAVTGGAISLEDTFAPVTMTIENCTIVGNSSRLSGAIEVNADSTIVLRDSIIRGNVATLLLDDPSASNGIRLPNRVDVTVSIDHTILAEGDVVDPAFRINDSNGYSVGVNGNLDVDPLFVAAAAGDFRLKVSPRSPAIDAGSRTAVAAGVNTLTATANNAPDSGTVDLGYHQPIP